VKKFMIQESFIVMHYSKEREREREKTEGMRGREELKKMQNESE
jgi:hypothetical protein